MLFANFYVKQKNGCFLKKTKKARNLCFLKKIKKARKIDNFSQIFVKKY